MSDTLTLPDTDSCDREPIHTPGAIQPHGMVLVVEAGSLRVRHVAGEIERRLDIAEWEDQPMAALIGPLLSSLVSALLVSEAAYGFIGQLEAAGGEMLDVTACVSMPYVIIELETASIEGMPASRVMDRVAMIAAGFERAVSVTAVCERAAIDFRHLTGFDRVMVYRFMDDDAGKVVAEDKRHDMHSFLHHHFPASDIPRQARALYVRNVLRVIPDVSYRPVVLRPAWADATPLDMSDISLRSVSPLHLIYLGNMGVKASASFSIVRDNVLWGLIACHNETPRLLTYDVRAACRSLVGSLARQIKAKDEAEGYRQRIRLRSFEDDIVILLSRGGSLDQALSNHLDEIGRMMGGDGVAVLRGQELVTSSTCPAAGEIRNLAAWLLARPGEPVFSTDCLMALYPPAAGFQQSGSGVLAVTLATEDPWLLLWFRAELIETINWAGNPHKTYASHGAGDASRVGHLDQRQPLTPRASFEAWAQTVRGHARGWAASEVDAAARLRTAVLDVQQNRRLLELNRQLTKILQDKDLLLQQKEFLIGEINHRVQNSLTLVSSFLAVQARMSDNPELHASLEEARRRLTAVALVHRRLYRSDQIEMVNAARYIEELCADTFSFMGEDWARHLSLDLAPVLIATDLAVTLGLVLTELLINSNKYAYGGAAGPIQIQLIEDRVYVHMIVSDRGSGIGSARKGFGSRIMEGLVKQLGGELTNSDNKPGLRVTVTMPVQILKPSAGL